MPIPTLRHLRTSRCGTNLDQDLGLQAWEGHPGLMAAPHRHNELELNFVTRGSATYFFGGRRIVLPAGSLMVFWAIAPHQLVDATPDNVMHWLTLPLSWFLHVRWPEPFRRAVLNGALVLDPAARLDEDRQFKQWQTDLARNAPEDREVVLLEAEARLKRLAARTRLADGLKKQRPSASHQQLGHAERMASFVADHCQDPLSVQEVAAHVNLHPNYAMGVFRKAFGTTIIEYLTALRIAQAQQTLVNTERTISEIALDSGFGSVSQFYVAFTRLCGRSPRAYRDSLR